MALVGALMEMIGVGLVFPLIQVISDPDRIAQSYWLGRIYNLLGFDQPRDFITFLGISMAAVFVTKNFYMGLFAWVQSGIVMRWRKRSSVRLMAGYTSAPYLWMIGRNSAELIRNIGLTGVCFDGFLNNLLQAAVNIIMLISIIGLLLWYQPEATVVAALVMGTLMAVQYRILGPLFARLGRVATEAVRERQKALYQGLGAMKETRILGRGRFFLDLYADAEGRTVANGRRVTFFSALPPLITETVMMVGMLAVTAFILLSVETPSEALAGLGVLAAAAFRMMPLMNRTLIAMNGVNQARAAVQIVSDEMSRYGAVADDGQTSLSVATEDTPRLRDRIELKSVSFNYPGSGTPALRDITTTIRRGESIGLVGPSGAGKTTLVDVLLGLLEPTSGEILLDGQSCNTLSPSWRRYIGYVPQTIYLTDDTIRANVAFGLLAEEIDDTTVWHALQGAQLADFVTSLKNGLDTILGEHGSRLSGGQRQRIGIARALYHDPDLLVLDEATSALDTETETQITETIRKFHGEKTLIVIAHRLSTLRYCDHLLYLRNSALIDQGDFAGLASRNEDFRDLLAQSQVPIEQ